MTVRTDIQRIVQAIGHGDAGDASLLLRYYGAEGAGASQAALAADLGVSRQAVHARIRRLLARIRDDHRSGLTLDAAARLDLAQNDKAANVMRRDLGGIRPDDAGRFYRDILGVTRDDPESAPLPRIPAAQFDALVAAVYGARRKLEMAAVRLVLVRGRQVDRVALESGMSALKLRRTALEIAQLHAEAIAAYG